MPIKCIKIRGVKVNALIYEIIVAEINAIKYFKAVNATLFTSDVTRNRVPAVRNRRDRDGSRGWREQSDSWAESICLRVKMTEQPTKLKLYVAFVKMNLAVTEAARL